MTLPANSIARKFADTYFVLDFDRCIGSPDKFHQALESAIEQEAGISTLEIQRAREVAEAVGGSFDTIQFVREMLAQTHSTSWRKIYQTFIACARNQDVFEPRAQELLSILDDAGLPYGILTYGRETWQLAKLDAADLLGVPHLVTRIKEKSQILTNWKHDSDRFTIPPAMTRNFTPLTVASIVFVDDKAVSFQAIPEGVRGVRVVAPSGKILPVQQGELPVGVTNVKGMAGVIELLFDKT